MYELDSRVLSVLKGRAAWQKGKIYMAMDELQNLLVSRFGASRPRPAEIRAAVRRLVRLRQLQWSVIVATGLVYLA